MIEKMIRVGQLYDIYGALLTDRQRKCLEFHYLQDLSLGEIAAHFCVSRQAVNDILRRSEEALEQYESVLKLLTQEQTQKESLQKIRELLSESLSGQDTRTKILQALEGVNKILEQEVGTE